MSRGQPHGYCTPGDGWRVAPTLPSPLCGPHTQPHSRRKQGPSWPTPRSCVQEAWPAPAPHSQNKDLSPFTLGTPIPSRGGERGLKQYKVAVFSLEDYPPCPSTCDANQRLEGPPNIWAEGVMPPLNHHPIQELGQQAGTLGSWLHSAAGGHSRGMGGDRLSKKGPWGSGRARCEPGQSLPRGWSPCRPAAPTAQPGRWRRCRSTPSVLV